MKASKRSLERAYTPWTTYSRQAWSRHPTRGHKQPTLDKPDRETLWPEVALSLKNTHVPSLALNVSIIVSAGFSWLIGPHALQFYHPSNRMCTWGLSFLCVCIAWGPWWFNRHLSQLVDVDWIQAIVRASQPTASFFYSMMDWVGVCYFDNMKLLSCGLVAGKVD